LTIDVCGVAEAVGVDWVGTARGGSLADPVQADQTRGAGPELNAATVARGSGSEVGALAGGGPAGHGDAGVGGAAGLGDPVCRVTAHVSAIGSASLCGGGRGC